MTRNKLIALTNLACFKARTTDEDRALLVGAVANPHVHEVLVGCFGHGEQACPLTLAGLFPHPDDDTEERLRAHDRFWKAFDALMNANVGTKGRIGGYVVEVVG
jgi:hypothetical protein